jgi:hypothetical protein
LNLVRALSIIIIVSGLALAGCSAGNEIAPSAVATGGAGTGGGGSTPTPAPTPGDGGGQNPLCTRNFGTMTAQIDGAAWTASCVQAAGYAVGVLTIVATNGTDVITLGVHAVVPGSYDAVSGGAIGTIARANGSAWTSGPGGTAAVTLTRIELAGATGTFSFTAAPVAGTSATGVRNVASGTFDVSF